MTPLLGRIEPWGWERAEREFLERAARLGAHRQPLTPAIAARLKMVVQTGPNTQSGGFQSGWRKAAYQGPRSVISAPSIATAMALAAAIHIGAARL